MTVAKINKRCGFSNILLKGFLVPLLFLSVFIISGTSSAKAAYEISDGSVKGLWHLNNDSTDSSGNAKNGTDSGVTYGSSYGLLNQGVSFNGSSGWIYTGQPLTGVSAMSISLWVKCPSTNANINLITSDDGTGYNGENYSLTLFGSGKPYFYIQDSGGSNHYIISNTALSTGVWYNIIATWSSGNAMKIYLNGVDDGISLSSNYTWSGTVKNGGTAEMFGRFRNSYSGQYQDDVAVFNKVLSGTEISNIYNVGAGNEICTTAGCATGGGGGVSSTSTPLKYNQIYTATTYYYNASGTVATTTAISTNSTLDLIYLIFKFIFCGWIIYLIIRKKKWGNQQR